ncbi:alcohol dehydrogenase catalytic domain-containing protein, partial [Rhizobium ruizarguesonis]
MKAARILEYKKALVLEDIPVPDIQPDEVLVKVAACGMCRSDVLLIDGCFQGYGDIPPPVIPGHEMTGTIEKIGR